MLLPLPGVWTTDVAAANLAMWTHLRAQPRELLRERYGLSQSMSMQLHQLTQEQVAAVAHSPVLHMRATPALTHALADIRHPDYARISDLPPLSTVANYNYRLSAWVRERVREDCGLALLVLDIARDDALVLRDLSLAELHILSSLSPTAHWTPLDAHILSIRLAWAGAGDDADLSQLDHLLAVARRTHGSRSAG